MGLGTGWGNSRGCRSLTAGLFDDALPTVEHRNDLAMGRTDGDDDPVIVQELHPETASLKEVIRFGDIWGDSRSPSALAFAPARRDRDGDGLFDAWETRGIDADCDGRVDLPLHEAPYRADINHKGASLFPADVSLELALAPARVRPGQRTVLRATVRNLSRAVARDAEVVLRLPGGTSFVSGEGCELGPCSARHAATGRFPNVDAPRAERRGEPHGDSAYLAFMRARCSSCTSARLIGSSALLRRRAQRVAALDRVRAVGHLVRFYPTESVIDVRHRRPAIVLQVDPAVDLPVGAQREGPMDAS